MIVGSSFPAVALIGETLPPLLLTGIRFGIATVAIGAFAWRGADRWPSMAGLALYAVMGLALAGFFGAMFWAARHATALSMAAIYVSVPLLAYGLGRLAGVERPDGGMLAVLAFGAAGALTLAWSAANGGAAANLQLGPGEGIFFLGCIASAAYPVLTKWGLSRFLSESAALRSFWSLVAGGLLIGLLGLAVEPVQALAQMTRLDFLLVSYLGIFSSGVTFWLMQRGTSALTPGGVTAFTYLTPFVSMLVLLVTQPEQLGLRWLPGSLAVMVAITILIRRSPAGPDAKVNTTRQARFGRG